MAYKWLPAIDTDACSGCGECQRACPAKCIDLVWDFARLNRPADCTSCDRCMEVCAFNVIQMDWMAQRGRQGPGLWCDTPPATAPAIPLPWFRRLLARLDDVLGLGGEGTPSRPAAGGVEARAAMLTEA